MLAGFCHAQRMSDVRNELSNPMPQIVLTAGSARILGQDRDEPPVFAATGRQIPVNQSFGLLFTNLP
jgi:hypothetical protein